MAGGATKRQAIWVIRKLRTAGHEALLAGGCVRDMLMGSRPADYDVATSATPKQVKKLFRRVRMVGAKFGVAMVICNREAVEVTTFRTDLSYTDGRRPDAVRFVSAREDALRRDFTINGMFYDPLSRRVVDHVRGQHDLAAGVIRAIGDAERRFSEDYLRMLRAARFAARFDFRIEQATAGAITRRAGRISQISGERVREEMEKMLHLPSAGRAVRLMHRLGLLEAVLPELFAADGRWERSIRRMEAVAKGADVLLSFSALLADVPPDELKNIARRWGASNRTRNSLIWLAEHLHDWPNMPQAPLAEVKRRLAHRDYGRLERLWQIEERAASGGNRHFRAIRQRVRAIDRSQIAPPPLLSGEQLKAMGCEEGRRLGTILSAVYEAQLNEEIRNRRSAARLARKLMGEQHP